MRKYIHYFNALKFRKDVSEKALYGFMLATFLAVMINNLGFSGWDGFGVIGPSFVLLIVIFATGFSQAETINQEDILLMLPFSANERVKYYYIHIFVVFFIAYLIFVGFLYLFIGFLWILSLTSESIGISNSTSNVIHYAGDLYSLAFSLIQISFYAGIGFIKSIKNRYIYFIMSTLGIILLHTVLLSIYNGTLGVYSVYEVINPTGLSLMFSISLLILSFITIYLSYRFFLKKLSYK